MEADERSREGQKKKLPHYLFPDNVLTATTVGKMSRTGKKFNVKRSAAHYTNALAEMKANGKKFFGGAFLVGTKKARMAGAYGNDIHHDAAYWRLSEDEKKIIKRLDEAEANNG